MWNYEKRLQYPVKITKTNPKIAQSYTYRNIGGPDGELGCIYEIFVSKIYDAV